MGNKSLGRLRVDWPLQSIQCICWIIVQWTGVKMEGHWMWEAWQNLCPFKPLVEGSIPSTLTNPHIWGFSILTSCVWQSPFRIYDFTSQNHGLTLLQKILFPCTRQNNWDVVNTSQRESRLVNVSQPITKWILLTIHSVLGMSTKSLY